MSKFSKSQGRRDSLSGQPPDPSLSRDKDYRDGYKSVGGWISNITSQPLSPPPSNMPDLSRYSVDIGKKSNYTVNDNQEQIPDQDSILDTIMQIMVYIIYGGPLLFLAIYVYYSRSGNDIYGILGAIWVFVFGVGIWMYFADLLVSLLYLILFVCKELWSYINK